MPETLRVYVETNQSGRDVFEQVLVRPLGGGQYLLLASPGFVLDVAKGDIVEQLDDGSLATVSRGGNVAVHVWGDSEGLLPVLCEKVHGLGGVMDGGVPGKLRIYTIPLFCEFADIEQIMEELVEPSGLEWNFNNVYDEEGRELLWWKDPDVYRRLLEDSQDS